MNPQDIETIPTPDLLAELERRLTTCREELNPLPEDIIIIIRSICHHFGVTETQIFSQSKVQGIAWARMAALTCIHSAGHSQTATAAVFRMDHTNVISARKRVQQLRDTDRVFRLRFIAALDEIAQSERKPILATG